MCVYDSVQIEVRGQLSAVASLLLSCETGELNLGHQVPLSLNSGLNTCTPTHKSILLYTCMQAHTHNKGVLSKRWYNFKDSFVCMFTYFVTLPSVNMSCVFSHERYSY